MTWTLAALGGGAAVACGFELGEVVSAAADGGDDVTVVGPTDAPAEPPGDAADAAVEAWTPRPDACAAGLQCAPVAPVGWIGPMALSAASAVAPGCPAEYPRDIYQGRGALDAGVAQCACTCGAPLGGGTLCSPAVQLFEDGLCVMSCRAPSLPLACTSFNFQNCGTAGNVYARISDAGAQRQCTPAIDASIPTPTWGSAARACALGADADIEQGACDSNERCLPLPTGAFGVCVQAAGDVPCPAGPYALRRVHYGAFTDTRACACGCSVSCAGTAVTFFNDTACNDPYQTYTAPQSCAPVNYLSDSFVVTDGGRCVPDSGVTGAVTPSGATTFCCLP